MGIDPRVSQGSHLSREQTRSAKLLLAASTIGNSSGKAKGVSEDLSSPSPRSADSPARLQLAVSSLLHLQQDVQTPLTTRSSNLRPTEMAPATPVDDKWVVGVRAPPAPPKPRPS